MVIKLIIILFFLTVLALAWVLWPLLPRTTRHQNTSSNLATLTGIFIVLLLPLIAMLVYYHLGTGQQQAQYWTLQQQAVLVKQQLAQLKNPQQLVERLKAHLHEHPDSARGWFLLGRLYMNSRQYDHALRAFKKAHQLELGQDEYTIAYAEAAFFAQKNHLTNEQQHLLHAVLQRMPNNVSVINLLALNAYSQKQFAQAVSYWERLLPLFTPGSQDSKMVLAMIARAQRQM